MPAASTASALRPGFADPVMDAQATFRVVLEALARPGRVQRVPASFDPPRGVHPAAAAVLLTLLDHETPLWVEIAAGPDEAAAYFAFHCGCPIAPEPIEARFALLDGAPQTFEAFRAGNAERPERSATLLLQLPSLAGGRAVTLSGPGIEDVATISPAGPPPSFWSAVRDNHAAFPCGVDLVLVSERSICGLPRTTRVED